MLKPLGRISAQNFGTFDFWRQHKSLCDLARNEGRTFRSQEWNVTAKRWTWEDVVWLTYEEWDYLFSEAVNHGIMAVYDDGKGNPIGRFANPFGMGLLRLWRAMNAARNRGEDAQTFARQYAAAIEDEQNRAREQARADDRRQAERREHAADELKARRGGSTVRVRESHDGKADAAGGW